MHYDTPPPPPRTRHLLWWPFAALVAAVAAGTLLSDATGERAWSEAAVPAWYVGWGAWVAWLCRRHGIDLRRLAGRPAGRGAWRYVAMAVPLLVFSLGVLALQVVLASWIAPGRFAGWMAEDDPVPAAPFLDGALDVLGTVALAPVVEELVFRGVLLRRWSERRGRMQAIVATSALFAVLHPGDLLGSFVFGVVLAVIRLRTRTLLVPIACHALYNGLTTLLVSGDGPSLPAAETTATALNDVRTLGWIAAACVAASLPVIVLFLRRHLPAARAEPDDPPSA